MVKLIRRFHQYFGESPWAPIPFQAILYLFVFGVSVRLAISDDQPPPFDQVVTNGFYDVWLILGISGPPLTLLSWYLIRYRSGRSTFRGLWIRLSSDIQVLTVLMSYHLVNVQDHLGGESRIFSRYIVSAALLYVVCLVIRDSWVLFLIEYVALRIRHDEDGFTGGDSE